MTAPSDDERLIESLRYLGLFEDATGNAEVYRQAARRLSELRELADGNMMAAMEANTLRQAAEAREAKYQRALQRIAIVDDADCAHANDPRAMTQIAREALAAPQGATDD